MDIGAQIEQYCQSHAFSVERAVGARTNMEKWGMVRCLVHPWLEGMLASLSICEPGEAQAAVEQFIRGPGAPPYEPRVIPLILPERVESALALYLDELNWSDDQTVDKVILNMLIELVFFPSSRCGDIVGVGALSAAIVREVCLSWSPDTPYDIWVRELFASSCLRSEEARHRECIGA